MEEGRMSDKKNKKGSLEADSDVALATKNEVEIELSKRYAVVFLNDDVTTFDFVVEVLVRFFSLQEAEAWMFAYTVHTQGRCAIGEYDYATAITRKTMVEAEARDNDFPLRLKVERIV